MKVMLTATTLDLLETVRKSHMTVLWTLLSLGMFLKIFYVLYANLPESFLICLYSFLSVGLKVCKAMGGS